MSKTTDINTRVDLAMNSLDKIQPAVPNPFFYTRLEARLLKEQNNIWDSMSMMIARPAVALATLAVVLIVNVFVVVQGSASYKNVPDKGEMASVEDLHPTSYYDMENAQP